MSVISGMKARELLRTRVLSRHWLEVWKSVPTLIFDLEEFTGMIIGGLMIHNFKKVLQNSVI